MNIYLTRHGESKGNIDKQEYYRTNDCDIELTKNGKDQAKKVGHFISDAIYEGSGNWNILLLSSTYKRAIQTRDITEQSFCEYFNLNKDASPLLIERQWGHLREIVDEVKDNKDAYFNFYYRPDGGESFFDCYQRVVMFFQELRTNPKYKVFDNVVIFSHGEWIRLALMYLDGISVEDFTTNRANPKNCEVIKRILK
jgi:broad specificity phosphatase PhoE